MRTASGVSSSTQPYYASGTVRTTEGTLPTDYTFTGQKLDASVGLMYYGARYYDAAIGRFAQPDSMIPNPYNPQSLNRYSYTLNNPLKYTDPTGHFPPLALVAISPVGWAAIGAGTVAIVGGTYFVWGPDAAQHRQAWGDAANHLGDAVSQMGKGKGKDSGWNPHRRVQERLEPVNSVEEGIKYLGSLCKEHPGLCIGIGTTTAACYISQKCKIEEEGEEVEWEGQEVELEIAPPAKTSDTSAEHPEEPSQAPSPLTSDGTSEVTYGQTTDDYSTDSSSGGDQNWWPDWY